MNDSPSIPVDQLVISLLDRWRQSVKPSSDMNDLIQHPLYQRVIGIGLVEPEKTTRALLEVLARRPLNLFPALREITGEDPVPDSATTFEEFRGAWLAWGQRSGIVK